MYQIRRTGTSGSLHRDPRSSYNTRISFLLLIGLAIAIALSGNGVSATKILLKTRPNTYFHLPIEFLSPTVKNGPPFLKFSNGYLVGVAGNSNGVYNFELLEDNSVVDVELVVQKESGLCYDPTEQIFSKALTLDEKLNIAKQTETEFRTSGKNRGLEFIDKPGRHHDQSSFITTMRYQIPCQDYYANLNSLSENKIESSITDIRTREKRQEKDNHHPSEHFDHLESSGDDDIDDSDDYDEDEEDEDIEERIIPTIPTPIFQMPSSSLTTESDADNFIVPVSLTSTELDAFTATPAITSSLTRSASVLPIQATPTHSYPHHDLLSSSALMFAENFADAGSGDFEINHGQHHSTTTRPTPPPHHHPDHDENERIIPIEPTESNEPKLPPGPILKKKIEKILIPAGKTLRFEIPKDAFMSPNNLLFQLESENGTVISKTVDSTSWIKFIGDSTIMLSPPTDHVSDYTYNLIAIDERTNARSSSEILISVRQRSKAKLVNHEFELTYTKSAEGEISDLISKIAAYTSGNGTASVDDLIMTKMETDANMYKILWTNETLYGGYNLNSCPKEDLIAIYKRLANPEGEPSPDFKAFLRPTYTPKELKINLIFPSHCDGVKPSEITKSTSTAQNPVARNEQNFPPQIRNPVNRIDATEGEYLILKVKEDFCYDPEDLNTKRLDLKLKDSNLVEINESNWLQFDSKNQEFYGLPMNGGDASKRAPGYVESESYVLTCYDSEGKSANDVLEVKIAPQQKTTYTAEFSLHFQSVPFTPQNMRIFMSKLATVFNDSITNIIVKNYQESVNQNTSQVHFKWFNKTDPGTEFEVMELSRVLFSEAGPPNKKVVEFFSPKFNLSAGQVVPKGKLLGSGTPHHSDFGGTGKSDDTGMSGGDDVTKTLDNTTDREIFDDTYLVTYIIPSVLIFVMILLASLIACLLSRKRKSVPTTSEEETKRFIKKGVPVIFQDEMEDASFNPGRGMADLGTGSRSRSPAILREERPPLPPQYNRRSPPSIDYRNSASNQPSYQPPPPVARGIIPSAGRGMRPGAGSAAANYRKPPPYVPP